MHSRNVCEYQIPNRIINSMFIDLAFDICGNRFSSIPCDAVASCFDPEQAVPHQRPASCLVPCERSPLNAQYKDNKTAPVCASAKCESRTKGVVWKSTGHTQGKFLNTFLTGNRLSCRFNTKSHLNWSTLTSHFTVDAK